MEEGKMMTMMMKEEEKRIVVAMDESEESNRAYKGGKRVGTKNVICAAVEKLEAGILVMGSHDYGFFKRCTAKSQANRPESTATIIDARGNRLQIKVPITAAEIMLDEPGHVVSPAQLIRKTGRIPVMKADEELSAEEVYLVVPASRARCKVSESEMAMIDSTCEKRRQKRRSSKVSPAATEGSGEKVEGSDVIKEGNITGLPGHQLASRRTWMPALDPISEGI
ncbi:hypothetical protein RHSIM_Rhsim13G0005200 [Rhododendron simsii]|uniref:Uncharacterized protein n=1 Tax=Rhododendron simsii TaxID=118357 RepID=A0A834G3Y8_RHOSS|nr:hypothetical protein RHSIM_Rhsim13G0005200 [Rhododendron simsii]